MHANLGGGRVTLYMKTTEVPENGVYVVNVGVAFCSPLDQFVKSVGRNKAKGNVLKKSPAYTFTISVPANERIKDYVYEEFLRLCEARNFSGQPETVVPSWAQKAAMEGWPA